MLSRAKASYLAAAASLVILSGVAVSPNIASAQSRTQLAQVEKRDAQDNRKSESRREQRRETSESREGRSSREIRSKTTTTRTVVRSDRDRRPEFIRDRDRRRVVIRSRPSTSVGFVVLGPRVVYRAYGPGWCRGLHNGRHWDRRVGWHAGRHYGPFRC